MEVYETISPKLTPYFQAINEALGLAIVRPASPQWFMVENVLDRAFQGLIRDGNELTTLTEYAENLKQLPSQYVQYRVKPGDTLEAIARRHKSPVALLAQANGLSRRKVVRPGQHLLVPKR